MRALLNGVIRESGNKIKVDPEVASLRLLRLLQAGDSLISVNDPVCVSHDSLRSPPEYGFRHIRRLDAKAAKLSFDAPYAFLCLFVPVAANAR